MLLKGKEFDSIPIHNDEYSINVSSWPTRFHWISSKHLSRLHSLILHLFPKLDTSTLSTKFSNKKHQSATLKEAFREIKSMDQLEHLLHKYRNIPLTSQDVKEYRIGKQPYYMDQDGDFANEFYEMVIDRKTGNEILVQIFP
ncbi:hypothetical protein C9374_010218 [Naegleria lovaniensis]|uniref:Uncharacterized protein n=1 Tax=Naegleria lovaniensis TaxID=51637 RepID=A0AA88GGH0_NAELO|nr:uncharacterized protein C9374_010218 [Naegleria lovaniensis]KAG2374844.1 hypothetical protein C9374_010218 [Naegleria lovaniensis]